MVNVVVIQARMGSRRLPGKSLNTLRSKTLIDHVIERAVEVRSADEVVVATTDLSEDDILVAHIDNNWKNIVEVYRGSSLDVQSRFLEVARAKNARLIARYTADDPFKDPEIFSLGFQMIEKTGADYVSVATEPIAVGLDVEIFTADALERARVEGFSDIAMEHVTTYLRESKQIARFGLSIPSLQSPPFRLTIDTEKDLEMMGQLAGAIDELGFENFGHENTLRAVGWLRESKGVIIEEDF